MALRLDHRPLYVRAAEAIKDIVVAEQLPLGARLPPEHVLCARLGVGRSTVREALKALEREGMLVSRQGAGTFIAGRQPALRAGIGTLRSTTSLIRDAGFTPGSRLLASRSGTADDTVAEWLGAPPGTPVVWIERVRTADGRPLCFVFDVLPGEDGLLRAYRAARPDSLLDFLRQHGGAVVGQSFCEIRAAAAVAEVAAALEVAAGTPLLRLDQRHLDSAGHCLFFSRSFWRTDAFAFNLLRSTEPP